MRKGRTPYKKYAAPMYRLYSWGLAALSRCRPLFSLALRILTSEKRPVRGRILPLNAPIGRPEQEPIAREVLERLIGRSEGIALMHECLCRALGGCAEYPKEVGCLVLGEAARSVHPALGRPAGAHEALERVDRALGLGLVPMVMRLRCDSILWSLDGSRMLTVCFCCPCHCLMLKAADARTEPLLAALPGVSLLFEKEKCIGCGRCAEACFSGAIAMRGGKPWVDREKCLACGRCAAACARGAFAVTADAGHDGGAVLDEC